MKATVGFGMFLLFLAGFALVYLMSSRRAADHSVPTAAELAASAWRPSIVGETRIDSDSGIYVQFESDGRLTGHAGCNNFNSGYRLDGNKIDVHPIGVTRMSCPPETMSVEKSFIEALQLSTTIAGAGNRMSMRDERDQVIARFVAVDRHPVD